MPCGDALVSWSTRENKQDRALATVCIDFAFWLCICVYVMWIHLNNSLASWKMHKIILSIQWKWNAVFWWQCLWPMRLARPSQCESHAFSLSLSPPFYQCVCFSMDTILHKHYHCLAFCISILYCVVYVLSDRECACSRSQGYCCKNILTCTFT